MQEDIQTGLTTVIELKGETFLLSNSTHIFRMCFHSSNTVLRKGSSVIETFSENVAFLDRFRPKKYSFLNTVALPVEAAKSLKKQQ